MIRIDSEIDRILKEVAAYEGLDERIVRDIYRGYWREIRNLMDEGDIFHVENMKSVRVPKFGKFFPNTTQKLSKVQKRYANFLERRRERDK